MFYINKNRIIVVPEVTLNFKDLSEETFGEDVDHSVEE